MSRYAYANLLRPHEELNTKSGLSWLQAASERYGAQVAPPDYQGLGFVVESAPQMTHGVDTLMHVGDMGYIGEEYMPKAAALAMAYHGYMRTGDPLWTGVWAVLGYFQPIATSLFAVWLGFGTPKAASRMQFKELEGLLGKRKKNPGRRRRLRRRIHNAARKIRRRRRRR